MNPDKPNNDNNFDAWLDEKRHTAAPDGFSDCVMERIASDETASVKPLWRSPSLSLSFWAKAAILTFALAGGLGRYALLIVCLFTG